MIGSLPVAHATRCRRQSSCACDRNNIVTCKFSQTTSSKKPSDEQIDPNVSYVTVLCVMTSSSFS